MNSVNSVNTPCSNGSDPLTLLIYHIITQAEAWVCPEQAMLHDEDECMLVHNRGELVWACDVEQPRLVTTDPEEWAASSASETTTNAEDDSLYSKIVAALPKLKLPGNLFAKKL